MQVFQMQSNGTVRELLKPIRYPDSQLAPVVVSPPDPLLEKGFSRPCYNFQVGDITVFCF